VSLLVARGLGPRPVARFGLRPRREPREKRFSWVARPPGKKKTPGKTCPLPLAGANEKSVSSALPAFQGGGANNPGRRGAVLIRQLAVLLVLKRANGAVGRLATFNRTGPEKNLFQTAIIIPAPEPRAE